MTKTMDDINLTNHFLISMPNMDASYFERSVIYICEHDKNGAMGLVINSPLDLTIANMLKQIDIEPAYAQIHHKSLERAVLLGGPVAEDRGFVLHCTKDTYQSSLQVTDKIALTTSKDILTLLGTEAQPQDFLVALGYSGWSTGQLEQEIINNAWLTTPADEAILFHTPIKDRWNKALKLMGIEVSQLSSQSGHA